MGVKIMSGFVHRPQKVVIYGPEGIGKSTLASDFPTPLFIDTEGGTAHMPVCRADWGNDWESLLNTVKEVISSRQELGIETLVIDTADWAEQLCIKHVLNTRLINGNPAKGVEDYGYGKGYTYVGEEFQNLLAALNEVIKNGINVVVTAHAKMRKFEQPDELGAYDRWEMKLSKQVAPLLKEWADMVLFCNYQTRVVTTESKTKKAQGGKRVIYTTHHPCWDAKNRHGLPEKLDMQYAGPIQDAIEGPPKDTRPEPVEEKPKPEPKKKPAQKKEEPKPATEPESKPDPEEKTEDGIEFPFKSKLEELKYMADQSGVTLGEIQQACVKTKLQPNDRFVEEYSPEFIDKALLGKWDSFVKFIKKNIKK